MMLTSRLFLVSLVLCFALPAAAESVDATAELRTRDQALLDAFTNNGVDLWQQTLAPEAIYVDENGVILPRAEFIKQQVPLLPGVSGSIKISYYDAKFSGDLATVIHKDDEEENYHGQILHAQYLTTETWQKRDDRWWLLLVHTITVLQSPPAVALSKKDLDSYTGKYTGGEGLTYIITLKGDHLEGAREGRPPSRLDPELRDVLFIKDQLRTRKIFQRDASGKVTGFIDRREGEDVIWKKI